MNIDSAKLISLLPGHAVAEEASASLTADGAMPDGFADALMEQIEALLDAKAPVELPKPLQNIGESQNINSLHSIAGLMGNKTHAQELAALFGKDLPMSTAASTNEDLEATLATLTEALKYLAKGGIAQDMAMPDPGIDDLAIEEAEDQIGDLAVQVSQNAAVVAMVPEEAAAQMQASEYSASDQPDDGQVGEALAAAWVDPVSVLPVREKAGNSVTPAAVNQEKAIPVLINAGPEPRQSQTSGEDASAADFLQQGADVSQVAQLEQDNDLNPLGKADKVEKPSQSEGRLPSIETEKASPRVTADIRQVIMDNNKVDMPAITKPVAHPDWYKELGERIVWMNNRAMPAAEIKLNPQHLGPISVRIDVNQDQASVAFTAQHAAVRDALEAAIPKLRDMMSAQQLNLGDVNVAQHFSSGQGQSHRFAQTSDGSQHGAGPVATDVAEEVANGRAVASNGLLSIYA